MLFFGTVMYQLSSHDSFEYYYNTHDYYFTYYVAKYYLAYVHLL